MLKPQIRDKIVYILRMVYIKAQFLNKKSADFYIKLTKENTIYILLMR